VVKVWEGKLYFSLVCLDRGRGGKERRRGGRERGSERLVRILYHLKTPSFNSLKLWGSKREENINFN
jgi:hypothetical protein